MKISLQELENIIQQEINSIKEGGYGEGSMARSQLGRTAELALMLQDMIGDDTNLEEWVESKITKSQDYLSSVLNYMRGEQLSEGYYSKGKCVYKKEDNSKVGCTDGPVKDYLAALYANVGDAKESKLKEGAELKIPVERYDAFKRKIEQWAMLFNKFTGYTRDLNLPDFNRQTDGRRIIRMAGQLESSLMKIMKEFDLNYKSYEDERYAQRQQLDRLPDEESFFLEINEGLEQLTPENMELLFDVMKKMATEPAIVTALGVGGMAAAIDKIKDKLMKTQPSGISEPTGVKSSDTLDMDL